MCCVGGSGAVVCGALVVPCPGVLWRLSAAAAVARLVADLLRVAAASPRFVGVCCRVFWRWPRQGASHGCGLTGPLSTRAVGCGPQQLCLPPATARLPLRRVVCEGVPPLVGRWWQAVVDCPCDSVAVCCCGGVCPGPALASSGACHGSPGSHGGAYCPHGSVGRSPGWRPLTYVACVGSGADAGRLQSAPLASVALAVLSLMCWPGCARSRCGGWTSWMLPSLLAARHPGRVPVCCAPVVCRGAPMQAKLRNWLCRGLLLLCVGPLCPLLRLCPRVFFLSAAGVAGGSAACTVACNGWSCCWPCGVAGVLAAVWGAGPLGLMDAVPSQRRPRKWQVVRRARMLRARP